MYLPILTLVQLLSHLFILLVTSNDYDIKIFHVIDNALWGEVDGSGLQGSFPCGNIHCSILTPESAQHPFESMKEQFKVFMSTRVAESVITVNKHIFYVYAQP